MVGSYDPGQGPDESWLVRFESAVRTDELINGVKWPNEVMFHVVATKLDGQAATWFSNAAESLKTEERSYEGFKSLLVRQNGRQINTQSWK